MKVEPVESLPRGDVDEPLDVDRREELAGEVDVQPAPLVDRDLAELVEVVTVALVPGEGEERHPQRLVRAGGHLEPLGAADDHVGLRRPGLVDGRLDGRARVTEDGGIAGEQAPFARGGRGPGRGGDVANFAEAQRRRRGPSDPHWIGERRRADVDGPRRAVGEDHEDAGRSVVGVLGPVPAREDTDVPDAARRQLELRRRGELVIAGSPGDEPRRGAGVRGQLHDGREGEPERGERRPTGVDEAQPHHARPVLRRYVDRVEPQRRRHSCCHGGLPA